MKPSTINPGQRQQPMIKNNRFLGISVVVGLVVVAVLVLVYRSITTSALIEQEERANTNIVYILANVILPQVDNLLEHKESLSSVDLERIGKLVNHAVQNTSVVKVKIINPSGIVLYSSDPSQTGESKYLNESFNSAMTGVPATSFSFRRNFNTFRGPIENRHIVSTYIPIRNSSSHEIIGVFEIYSDVTGLFRASERIQLQVGGLVVASLFLIYLILFKMARRADKVITRQHLERLANAERVRYQTYHDQLTGLPNRASFIEQLDAMLEQSAFGDTTLAVLILDIDQFKLVNDSLGHRAGDELLRIAARRLQKQVRENDLLYRLGGDEFAIITERASQPSDAAPLAQRIIEAMRDPIDIEGHSIVPTVSVGISVYPRDDTAIEKLVKNADAAMYRAKQAGRNQYCFYSPEMNSQAADRLRLESALQQALGNDEFVLHYQPRVDAQNRAIVGMEALLRWQRPGEGLVPPGQFIPILEDRDLIVDVGEWVLRRATRQVRDWLDRGLDPRRVSVNVSSRQFRKENFIDVVHAAIEDAGIPAGYLELELTESLLLDHSSHAIEIMQNLKAIGVKLSIDDFGTGYSSLGYLKRLPIDFLKIDRGFISEVTSSEKDAAIVNTITTLAAELRIGVVAEGVETEDQWRLLRTKHCQELQGFYFSRPVEAKQVESLLAHPRLASGL